MQEPRPGGWVSIPRVLRIAADLAILVAVVLEAIDDRRVTACNREQGLVKIIDGGFWRAGST